MSTTAASQVVTFRLGADLFAADIFAVERVLRYAAPTAVPSLPPWIDGVLEYRSRVVPVIDLRSRFGLERREPRPETRIIVFAVDDDWVGVVVDAVLEVAAVDPTRLAPPPKLFRGLVGDYLRGLLKQGDALLIFLDVTRVLTSTERLTLQQSMHAVQGVARNA
jgi:purine-binding chemotaxis protein CheW